MNSTENTLASMFPVAAGPCAAIDRRRGAEMARLHEQRTADQEAEYRRWKGSPEPADGALNSSDRETLSYARRWYRLGAHYAMYGI